MKKIISILIMGILVVSYVATIGNGKKADILTIEIHSNFSEPSMKQTAIEGQTFVEMIADKSFGTLYRPGKPLIPHKIKTFEVPFGTKITDVSCEFNGMQSFLLSQKILPAPEPVIIGIETQTVFTMNNEIYNSNEFYPNDWYKISTGSGLNDNNIQKTFITVQIFPARYNPIENKVLYVEDMTISIQYQEPKDSLLSGDNEFDMVVIAPKKFENCLQPLVDHKNDVEVKTFLKTTEEIYIEYNGVDKPEKIKYFIKDAKETSNITYVLLVGGLKSPIYGKPRDDANQGSRDWNIPVRYTNLVEQGSFYDPGFISDLYYMDIYDGDGNFSSWDSNDDGIFAKWTYFGGDKDIIDFYPDVYVGRLACRNRFEVKTVVNKIIKYESTPVDQSWYNRMVLVGGDSFDDSVFGTNWPEDEMLCDKYLSYMNGFEPVRLYASNRENDSEHTPLTSNIIREINSGCGFIVFSGHGQPFRWNTNWCGEFDGPIQDGGISNINLFKIWNGKKLPICCIAGGCHNSLFNVSLLTTFLDKNNSNHLMTYGRATSECLGWSLVRRRGGGAIANFGYPSCTFFSPGENGDLDGDGVNEPDMFEALRPYMIRQYYKIIGEGAEFLGDVAGGAVRNYLNTFPGMGEQLDAKIIEQVIFFGDPSLKIGGYS